MQDSLTQLLESTTEERLSRIRKLALVCALALAAIVSTVHPRPISRSFHSGQSRSIAGPTHRKCPRARGLLIEGDRIKQIGSWNAFGS